MAVSGSDAAKSECLAIIGVGLIGGSVGLAARRSGRYGPILGVERNAEALEVAQAAGCIDAGGSNLAQVARQADIIVVCTSVNLIADIVIEAAQHCRPGTLITDVGSTKATIVDAVERGLAKERLFIGSHPLAGSERCGPQSARTDLFDGRLAVLTPTEQTSREALHRATQFWESLGARTWAMLPEDHDRCLATTSHLPHLVAAALAVSLPPVDPMFTATGFRDTTRLASGDPTLWTAILRQNALHVREALHEFRRRIDEFDSALRRDDAEALKQLLTEAKKVRDDLGN